MADSIDQLRVSFVEETRDLINELEDILLSLENDTASSEVIDQLFRSIHTIKGSGGMLGFEKVLEVTHDLEDIYSRVRNGEMDFSAQLKDISLETIDVLKLLLENDEQLDEQNKIRFTNLCLKIQVFDGATSVALTEEKCIVPSLVSGPKSFATYLIQIVPALNIPSELSNSKYLVNELALLGSCVAFSKSDEIIKMNDFETVARNASWVIFLSTKERQSTLEDVFALVKDDLGFCLKILMTGNLFAIEEAKTEFENLKEKAFDLSFDEFTAIADNYSDRIIVEEKLVVEQEEKQQENTFAHTDKGISSIRVATDKIDQLMNLVSEMVTLQARLNLIASESDNVELKAVAEKHGAFAKQLRDNAFTISLVPFGVTLTRYKRLIHDLSEQLNKKIEFIAEGEDTVLDKKIIEQLSDPIMHILRNCVDHGIELPEEREQQHKDPIGKIQMYIYHQSNNVIIKVVDDGRGIDLELIRDVAIKKKFITKDQVLSESEMLNLIFLPGFTSAKTISNVSGRGVGLDVVKRNISNIRGSIEIQTKKGKGTTFLIKLPLSLSIIDGLQVRISDRDFIIPLIQVEKIATLNELKQESVLNQVMALDGEQVPFFDLRNDFNIGGECPERREFVLVSYENEKVALIVDAVVGENQTVLKPLGKHYKKQDFLSGGTIMGDGSVALVLDVNKVVTGFSKNKN